MRPGIPAVAAAFEALRFGRENVLDLRAGLPSAPEATRRAESFLRERQVAKAHEVLVITGRGNRSADGMPVVRPAVMKTLAKLRRQGVVRGWQEHTPGSFVVVPAPISALFESPRRRGKPESPAVPDPDGLAGLDQETRLTLRRLAIRSLQTLGAPATDSFIRDEMLRQFSVLCVSIPPGPGRDAQLYRVAMTMLDELDDAG